jgi:hypothetical protein
MIFHKLWPLALLFVAAVVTILVCLNSLPIFQYTGFAWGIRAAVTDILLVFITLTAALVAAVPDVRRIFSPDGVEQIVGRERRGRVSQLDSSGDA